MKIPFVDLSVMHRSLEPELLEVFTRVLRSSAFVLGPEVRQFEEAFAAYVDTQHCVALTNGTAALHLTLLALGIKPGDEVITVAHTFIATAEAISAVSARPVFVDIDPLSYTMDPALLERAITPRTRAILPVHLYGQAADMDAILEIGNRHAIPVIEDACQAHGAEYKGRRAGSLGVAGCFSFYPGKNLGACGEGGAVTTDDPELAHRIQMWRDHGSRQKYVHQFPGLNMRMDGVQGGILAVKLQHLDCWNEQRRQAAAQYRAALAGTDIKLPAEMPWGRHVYHLYVIQANDREALRHRLQEAGIESGLHYPVPLHLQEAYRSLGYYQGSFPVTEAVVSRIVSLPMYPGISTEAVARVAEEIMETSNVA
jgi:dTDP-4-amino-4,6-dideoxygalactose transaminase